MTKRSNSSNSYEISFKKSAIKEIAALPKNIYTQVMEHINSLRTKPHQGKILHGTFRAFRKLAVGSYRIIYKVDDGVLTILVVMVEHRKQVYQRLERQQ